jgi:hypothetical protein
MIHVFLDGSFQTGHHEFADSVNSGPWGRALTQEFIQLLEECFRLVAKPYARFLTGHSSGGWSTLWLASDLSEFLWRHVVDRARPGRLPRVRRHRRNRRIYRQCYRKQNGAAKNLVRMSGKEIARVEEFARQEEVMGECGG